MASLEFMTTNLKLAIAHQGVLALLLEQKALISPIADR